MATSAREYIRRKGWQGKEHGGHFVTDCPLCRKEKHFYINMETGAWDCKVCGSAGNTIGGLMYKTGDYAPVSSVQRQVVNYSEVKEAKIPNAEYIDSCVSRFVESGKRRTYCERRGLLESVVDRFKVGVDENGWITYPYYEKGKLENIIYSKEEEEKAKRRITNARLPLFNIDSISSKTTRVAICEGATDAIALVQAGFDGSVVANGGGASYAGKEITEPLFGIDDIWIFYDADDAGKRGTEKLVNLLGAERCTIVHLPMKDVNECVKAGLSIADITKDIDVPKNDSVIELRDCFDHAIENLDNNEYTGGFLFPWSSLNNKIRFRRGELEVITGHSGMGKSQVSIFMALKWAQQDIPVMIGSFEMSVNDCFERILEMMTGKSYGIGSNPITKEDIDKVMPKIWDLPVSFMNDQDFVDLDKIEKCIRYSRRKYGTQIVLLDNLDYFCGLGTNHEASNITITMQKLNALAKKLNICIIILAHPDKDASKPILKLQKSMSDDIDPNEMEYRRISMGDLKGSQGIAQTAHNVLCFYRRKYSDRDPMMYILKKRRRFGSFGSVNLKYINDGGIYLEDQDINPRKDGW